ncbi:MAG TPA: nitronate monooxygenase [Trebonia sp.]|nr:nitronate monooxygenase [Trebonia sp.]
MANQSILDWMRRPVVVAPMAGGPSTPELVIAAADAGAVGFLAAGYKTPAAMAAEIAAVRAAGTDRFGVNLFVPGVPTADAATIAGYVDSLASHAEAVGAALGEPTWDDDLLDEKIAISLADPPALVSFTFGCPPAGVIAALSDAGCLVVVTVTGPDEAAIAAAAGADLLCVQGSEAGAHRGTFANDSATGEGHRLIPLMGHVAAVTDLPLIAAGGIMEPGQVQAALTAGAVAVQCGTAFLRCRESGANPLYKDALVDPRYAETAMTRAFSGRWARGLVNRFMLENGHAPAGYPEINNATRALRAAAASRGDTERMSLWAGQGYRSAHDWPAGEIIAWLCGEDGGTDAAGPGGDEY